MGDRPFELAGKRVWVAGHNGMVGSAIVQRLATEKCDILKVDRRSLDLTRQADVEAWMTRENPDAVIIAAARVGGILANDSHPVEFLTDNLQIQTNIIATAHAIGVCKLLFLGSSCVYPRLAPQPLKEESLFTGPLEPTNQWYAVAKIAGIRQCQAYRRAHQRNFISAMPTNLYGPGDNFDLQSSHVLPALIVKAHRAKTEGARELNLWGSGTPRREFLHVDDLADACVFLVKNYSENEHINVGYGCDLTIRELAEMVAETVGFTGTFACDSTKPDGMPQKLLDCSRLTQAGWNPSISLREGIASTYDWYREHVAG